METKQIALDYLHGDHRKWMDELKFCKEEVAYFEHRLEQMIKSIGNKDLLPDVEHFQNQFIREREVIDELKHNIRLREQELASLAQTSSYAEEDYHMKQHVELGDKMIRFNELYSDLKKSYNRFSVRWIEQKVK